MKQIKMHIVQYNINRKKIVFEIIKDQIAMENNCYASHHLHRSVT